MDASYSTPLWDLSQASTFSQIPEDEFLQLLQKQFPTTTGAPADIFGSDQGVFVDGVNPQSTTQLPGLTPPSDDSSPSPPSMSESRSRRQSTVGNTPEQELKRKASDDSLEEGGPNQKNQHTEDNGTKKNSSRKKGGDESRLLKRKEQNRAAQRAFRERKEKHVKDLEDKVAALEAKNDEKSSENDNLKDLLARLQNENMALKQASFTFSAPKDVNSNTNTNSAAGPSNLQPQTASPSAADTSSSMNVGDLDWNSLTTFDPNMLALLDEPPQMTATDTSGHMGMDIFGGGPQQNKTPYTTIASNPMFMSFADFGSPDSQASTSSFSMNSHNNSSNALNHNTSGSTTSFSTSSSPFAGFEMPSWGATPSDSNNSHSAVQQTTSFDDLFSGNFLGNPGLIDFSVLMKSPPSQAVSPVSHASQRQQSNASASSSSPALTDASSMFSKDSPPTDLETPMSAVQQLPNGQEHDLNQCPKTKEEARQRIMQEGLSPFATPAVDADKDGASPGQKPGIWKGTDAQSKPSVMCTGGALPRTEQSEKNVEVLSAWRSITSNPNFKDADINDLCAQFTAKARCDGTKVVLEPSGVQHILQAISTKPKSPSPGPQSSPAGPPEGAKAS